MSLPKLHTRQAELLHQFVDEYIGAIESALISYRAVHKGLDDPHVRGQIVHYQTTIKALNSIKAMIESCTED